MPHGEATMVPGRAVRQDFVLRSEDGSVLWKRLQRCNFQMPWRMVMYNFSMLFKENEIQNGSISRPLEIYAIEFLVRDFESYAYKREH